MADYTYVRVGNIINFIISLHKHLFYGIILKMKRSPSKGLPGLSTDYTASHLGDHPKRLPQRAFTAVVLGQLIGFYEYKQL